MDNPGKPPTYPLTGPAHRVAILISDFGDGGVERMLVNLARGFADHDIPVDFLVKDTDAPFLPTLAEPAHLINLGAARRRELRSALVQYLETARPAILMSAKTKDDRLAVRARHLVRVPTRVFLRIGTNLSARLDVRKRSRLQRWWRLRALRRLYARADGIICVSQGVADDLSGITGIAPERLHVLRNPVVTPELAALAAETVEHPWFTTDNPPVILGAGGLRLQKNFPLLIRAFARVRSNRPCRLMILGDGRQRARLEGLARQLGIGEDVALPGFVNNPYAYMAQARLFVLSSYWEGSPNVLAECLAVGTPVVSTDCPSGPREILQGGRFGSLVPVDDEDALTEAMITTLDRPLPAEQLRSAVVDYTLERSAKRYLQAFELA